MDLRVLALRGAVTSVTAAGPGLPLEEWQPLGQAWEPLLMTGCIIAQEMRAVLKVSHAVPCGLWLTGCSTQLLMQRKQPDQSRHPSYLMFVLIRVVMLGSLGCKILCSCTWR